MSKQHEIIDCFKRTRDVLAMEFCKIGKANVGKQISDIPEMRNLQNAICLIDDRIKLKEGKNE